jgi:hypothetical protein
MDSSSLDEVSAAVKGSILTVVCTSYLQANVLENAGFRMMGSDVGSCFAGKGVTGFLGIGHDSTSADLSFGSDSALFLTSGSVQVPYRRWLRCRFPRRR